FIVFVILFFFFSSRRRHTRFSRDWSSDVCSSDLTRNLPSNSCSAPLCRSSRQWWQVCSNVPLRGFWRPRQPDRAWGTQRAAVLRSEERRVGKECRAGWSAEDYKQERGLSCRVENV